MEEVHVALLGILCTVARTVARLIRKRDSTRRQRHTPRRLKLKVSTVFVVQSAREQYSCIEGSAGSMPMWITWRLRRVGRVDGKME